MPYLSPEVLIVVPREKVICNCNDCKCALGNLLAGGLYFKLPIIYGDFFFFWFFFTTHAGALSYFSEDNVFIEKVEVKTRTEINASTACSLNKSGLSLFPHTLFFLASSLYHELHESL